MADIRLYRMDREKSCPSNCFPSRTFLYQRNEGAGHWLVAHRNTVKKKYRILQLEKSSEMRSSEPEWGKNEEHRKSEITGNILDGPSLMSLHCVDKPSDLCSADISEKNLHLVKLEGLEEFDNIAYINASVNYLTLEAFNRFPSLRELELSLNGLRSLVIQAGDFPRLEVLDLSYNNLSTDAILALGLIPCLKVLHLTGNQLHMLPSNMAGQDATPDDMVPQTGCLFNSLEVLMLDDNKLSSGVFSSLAGLKRLRHLNLQGNYISEVSYVQIEQPQDTRTCTVVQGGDLSASESQTERKDPFDASKHHQEETLLSAAQKDNVALKTVSPPNLSVGADGKRTFPEDVCLPLPKLCYLNLADNEIVEEEALLAVALFPILNELVIHSNPLTTQRSGDPQMLTSFLRDRLGINIIRKKMSEPLKPHMVLPINPKRTVKTKVPKVPKLSWFEALSHNSEMNGQQLCLRKDVEQLSPPPLECQTPHASDCLSQASPEEREDIDAGAHALETVDTTTGNPPDETPRDGKSFFVTEICDAHDSADLVKSDEAVEHDKTDEKTEIKTYPKKFIGYEILFDAEPDPDMLEPVGIQNTVRTLEQALKNLLVYRDSKADLDRPQKPYVERERKVLNLPPVKPRRLKGEQVGEILTKMKEKKTIIEVPLDKVLKGKSVFQRDYGEAMTLLKDMRQKYKMVYSNTVEQARRIETKESTNSK